MFFHTSTTLPLGGVDSEDAPAGPGDDALGGLMLRGVARVVDVLSSLVVFVGAIVVTAVIMAIVGPRGSHAVWAPAIDESTFPNWVVALLGATTGFAVAEWIGGATLGKLLCGLRVTTADLDPISFGAAFRRSFAFWFESFLFGFVAMMAITRSPLRQRHGDIWAGTVVVRRAAAPDRTSGLARALLGVIAGLAADGVFLSVAMTVQALHALSSTRLL
jgi:uncharacterized RDD family membrane protein YckC